MVWRNTMILNHPLSDHS